MRERKRPAEASRQHGRDKEMASLAAGWTLGGHVTGYWSLHINEAVGGLGSAILGSPMSQTHFGNLLAK